MKPTKNHKTNNSKLSNPNSQLKKGMRDAFGEAILDLAKSNEKIVALSADLGPSVRLQKFSEVYPDRYFEMGVAEQNMLGVASGLALEGLIPFTASFAAFNPGRNWDQLRVSVCYQNANVKVIGAHAGLNVGPDGATHQAMEDIAITRCLPNLTVIAPVDYNECYQATLAIAEHNGPVYMRFPRTDSPIVTDEDEKFEIGKAKTLKDGKDLTIIGIGPILLDALKIANKLKEEKGSDIRVLNCSSIKPLDKEAIIKAAKETGKIITVEDHQIHGGIGSAVAEVVTESHPVPIKMIGIDDTFGESGETEELFEKYGLGKQRIEDEISQLLERK